jgi:hypothetical protein
MMDKIRKRILLDLFASPMTVIPATIGASLLFVSGIFGGNTPFYGILGLLVGFGALLTNFVFNLDKISQKASKKWHQEQQQKKEDELNALDAKLVDTPDPRDERVLRNLRAVYSSFCEDLKNKELGSIPVDMLSTIDKLFQSCIQKLELSLDMMEMAKTVTGKVRNRITDNRNTIIEDIEQSILDLSETINEVRTLRLRSGSVDLNRLREQMKTQLQVAKATEERLEALDQNNEMDRFREYEDLAE